MSLVEIQYENNSIISLTHEGINYAKEMLPEDELLNKLQKKSLLNISDISTEKERIGMQWCIKKGLDKETEKTKFSGGSELVSSGKITTNSILLIAIIALLISGIIGLYILQFLSTVIFWIIVVLILFGGISVIFYASYFTHLPYMSELFVTVSFALVGLGIFLVMTNNLSNLYSIFLFACIPSGLQVGVAMIANEMPDKKADKKYGRKSMVIMLSDAKKASILYFLFQSIGYVLLCIGIIEKVLPMTFLVVFALIPFMYIIGKGIKNYKTPKSHEKIMGLNSIISFLYLFLILIAFVA